MRAFSAVVTIEGTSDRLLPDLTAAVDVEVERVRDALVVRRDAVRREGGKAARPRPRRQRIATRDVTLGPAMKCDVVVTSASRPARW